MGNPGQIVRTGAVNEANLRESIKASFTQMGFPINGFDHAATYTVATSTSQLLQNKIYDKLAPLFKELGDFSLDAPLTQKQLTRAQSLFSQMIDSPYASEIKASLKEIGDFLRSVGRAKEWDSISLDDRLKTHIWGLALLKAHTLKNVDASWVNNEKCQDYVKKLDFGLNMWYGVFLKDSLKVIKMTNQDTGQAFPSVAPFPEPAIEIITQFSSSFAVEMMISMPAELDKESKKKLKNDPIIDEGKYYGVIITSKQLADDSYDTYKKILSSILNEKSSIQLADSSNTDGWFVKNNKKS